MGDYGGVSGTASVLAYTQGQVTGTGYVQMPTPDPSGANVNSRVSVNTAFAAAHGGAEFAATVFSTGDRFQFQRKPYGAEWRPTLALDPGSGYWDYEHRTYGSGGVYSYIVPSLGASDLRMVRVAGVAGAGTCVGAAHATHNSYPTPPPYAGKRDVTLMVRAQGLSSSLALVSFDVMQENDDRTRTASSGVSSRAVRTLRRYWIQGWDAAYSPTNATDKGKVVLVSRPNGVINAGNLFASDAKFEMALLTAPGRSVSLREPFEFQNALGAAQMHISIAAMGSVGLGLLTMTVFGFETL